MTPEHYSDDLLISYQDGEVSRRENGAIGKHLETCWTCRTRLSELERQIQEFTKLCESQDFPGPGWGPAMKAQILDQQAQLYDTLPDSARHRPIGGWMRWCVAAAGIAGVAVGLAVYLNRPMPSTSVLISRSEQAEEQLYSRPAHQVLRVEVRQTRPRQQIRVGHVEVWSDPAKSRYSMRWRDDRGTLQHALWRPEAGQAYIFHAGAAESIAPSGRRAAVALPFSELGNLGLNPDNLETAFVKWLESRDWAPVEIASGVRVFMDHDGATAKVERSSDGRTLSITASRQLRGIRAELTMEVNAADSRPRLVSIRFENAEKAIEFRLVAEQPVANSVRWEAAVFRPDVPLVRPDEAPHASLEPPSPHAPPDAATLAAAEIGAWYALHRLGLCAGEPIDTAVVPNRGLEIRGVADNEAKKAEIVAGISQAGDPAWMHFDIQTADSAAQLRAGSSASGAARAEPVVSNPAPAAERVEAYLRSSQGNDAVPAKLAALSNRALMLSNEVWENAWAVRRVTGKFGGSVDLSPESLRLLDQMIRDHAAELRQLARQERTLLGAVWPSAGRLSQTGTDDPVAALVRDARRVHELTVGLFTGAGMPPRVPSVDEAGAELVETLARLDADAELAANFKVGGSPPKAE